MAEKKYYWLKLKRDFFKRHDIQIIEAMENGKDYILFYLKLLCESVDHEGNLRFSEQIPYNEQMLATITNTNVDVVRNAIKIFTELGMIDILDDGTVYMSEVNRLLGCETKWAEKKRKQRENQKKIEENKDILRTNEGQCPQKKDNVPSMSDKSKSKSIEIEKEIEKEIDTETENISEDEPPTPTPSAKKSEPKHKYGEYKHVMLKDSEIDKLKEEYGLDMLEDCITFLDEYIEMKGYKAKSHYLCIRKWVIDAVKERQRKQSGKNGNAQGRLDWIDNIEY